MGFLGLGLLFRFYNWDPCEEIRGRKEGVQDIESFSL
jgi:hypothetical protein